MRGSNALHLFVCFLTLLAATGCASQPGSERLANGDWRLRCDGPLSACLAGASKECSEHGYDVVSAREEHDMEGGSPYAGEFVKSRAVVRCRRAVPLFGRDPNQPVPPSAAPAPVKVSDPASAAASTAPPPSSAPRCVPGTSQACATPSGCTGAQVCNRDGASFGACECAAGLTPSPAVDAGAP